MSVNLKNRRIALLEMFKNYPDGPEFDGNMKRVGEVFCCRVQFEETGCCDPDGVWEFMGLWPEIFTGQDRQAGLRKIEALLNDKP